MTSTEVTPLFNPDRLRLARERAGMTIVELAQAIGVTSRQVSNYERGASVPSETALREIGMALSFPERFFFGGSVVVLRDENATFRSLRRTTAAQRNKVLAVGSLAMQLDAYIERRFDLPAVDVPDLTEYAGHPEAAAAALRSLWQLDEKAIPNAIALLEVHGIRVFSLAEDIREVNAFSVWVGERPYVFLNTTKSAEASRFDAMHELAHLVLHRQGHDIRQMESEAHAFAGAMLMPAPDVRAATPALITLAGLVKLKRRWGVSVSALAHRLHDLQLLGPWPYRNMCIEISTHGYRTKEPNPMERESSKVLAKVFAALRQEGVTPTDLAAALHIPREEISRLIFGLAIVGFDGGSGSGSSAAARKSGASHLRRIK